MHLSYEKPSAFGPVPEASDGDWESWAAEHRPPAAFLSAYSGRAVHGFGTRWRFGGVFVQPSEVVLGIRSWDDASEGVLEFDGERMPYAFFEIEKIVRMMLHQSGLAFEILASPVVLNDEDFPARRIIDAAVTHEILHHYRDVASGWMARLVETKGDGAEPADVFDVVRNALTGRALADGRVAFDLWQLADEYGADGLVALLREIESGVEPALVDSASKYVESLIASIDSDKAALPASPRGYDWLNDLVVASRMRRKRET